MQKLNNIRITKFMFFGIFLFALGMFTTSCDFDFDLPEAGSQPDKTPPSADFSTAVNEADYLTIEFTNLSASATDYSWSFGDGSSSTDKDPAHTYAAEGSYTVELTSSDKLGVSSTVSKVVVVEEVIVDFTPVILEPGFEDLSLPDGTGDGRDSWRNDAGGVIQITSSPVYAGAQAAKLPSAGDRVGQQVVAVVPNTDYVLSFYYTMKADPGTLTVAVLDALVDDVAKVPDATIASGDFTDNTDPNTFVKESIPFNTGDNTEIVIYFGNTGSECRLDDFSIE